MLKPPTAYEPPPPPPLIDQDVRDKALKKLQALAKGNGIKAEAITIDEVKAQTLSFQAHAFIRLATNYTTQSLPGKIDKGEPIGTPEAFEGALRNITTTTQRDPGRRKTIIDQILARPNKGYGARDQVVKFDSLAKDYVSHEGCSECNTTGEATCGKCGGGGYTTCQTCHGRQNILCPHCRGNGSVTHNGKTSTCTRCRGKTRVMCPACQGNGQTKCKNCGGGGKAPCARCKASGYISHMAKVELIGHLHFNYDRQGLPIELTKLIDAFSLRYIEKKDIELGIETPSYQEDEPAENIPIIYNVRVPYGEITFNLGKKRKITCIILGWNGELIKGTEFLDTLTKKGQVLLEKAANGQGNVGENLRKAASYRILREAVIIAASQSQIRTALSKLLQKYPVGISSESLMRFLMQANQAMQIITKKPRLIGLSLGTIIFAALASGYYLALRELLLADLVLLPIDPKLSLMICDVITLLIGTLIIVLTSQIIAGQALKKSLTGLASPATIQRIMPKIGWTLWAGFSASLAITAAFYYLFILAQ